MKNKGFTLTELLAVLIIIGIISAIVVPNISKILKNQRNKLYIKQVDQIVKIAENWASKNLNRLSNDGSIIYVNLYTLVKDENIQQSDIIDPRNEKPMEGCVSIIYNLEYKQYEFTFINAKDSNYKNECDNSL